MKRVAIISPCILPVPATKGGAVEGLITRIIEDNEKQEKLNIDLYCINDESVKSYSFKNSHIIPIDEKLSESYLDKMLDAYYRRAKGKSSKRLLDKHILFAFSKRIEELNGGYDAVVVQNMMSTAQEIVNFCRGKYEIPVYFHMHNCVDVYRSPRYIKQLVRNGVKFISVSEYIKSEILECDKNAIVHVLYNGVDLGNCVKKDDIRSAATSFLYSGRIIPGKGVKELVIAFEKMLDKLGSDKAKDYRLDIIGFSEDKTAYEKSVLDIAKPYKENIRCLSRISSERILKKYYDYDVVVMPTKNMEPFGLVALETIARGVPLITTNSGALPEVVGDGAVIVDKDNDFIGNLERAMEKIATDYEARKTIADKGYERAREVSVFNADNYYSNFESIIADEQNAGTITVIVPVYNVEDYLDRCVDTLINQTYSDLEIILVDDGSTDNSGAMCDKYAQRDSRIKVIHQVNQGLSAARNSGLDIATGDYIFLCDSDDYLQKDALEKLLCKMNRDHANIVACGITMVGDREGLVTDTHPGIWSGHESVIQMMRNNNLCSVAWNKLYKRELFEGVRYPVGMLHEDEATTYKLLYRAGIVSYTPVPYYNYFQRNSSIMSENVSGRYGYFLDAIEKRIRFFDENSEKDLVDHSRITYLEGIKYGYRNESDPAKKNALIKKYKEHLSFKNAPKVYGYKKMLALLLWKYVRY